MRIPGVIVKSKMTKAIKDHKRGGFHKADCPPEEYTTRRRELTHHLRLLWQLNLVKAKDIEVELYSIKGFDYAKIFNTKGELKGYLIPRDKNNRFKIVIMRKKGCVYERSFRSPESFQICTNKEILRDLFKE